jgi:hypothetical protein
MPSLCYSEDIHRTMKLDYQIGVAMTDEIAKKKQHSTRELLTGGSIFVVGLPFVAVAFAASLMVLIATLGAPPELRLTLVVVYGSLLAALLFLTWRVIRRSAKLMVRIHGLRREKQRTATLAERDMSRLELNESEIDAVTTAEDEAWQAQRGR